MPHEPIPASAAPLPALQGIGCRFRPSWRLLRLPIFWVSPSVLTVVFGLLCATMGHPRLLTQTAYMLGMQGALFYGTALCYVLFFPVHVGPDGVRSHTFWGTPAVLRWDEIVWARTWKLPGFPYVLIGSNRRWCTLWAPGLTEDPTGFAAAVREYGGPDTPVARWLESQGR